MSGYGKSKKRHGQFQSRRRGYNQTPRDDSPKLGRCEDCNEEVLLIKHIRTGIRAPINLKSDSNYGNITAPGNFYSILTKGDLETARHQGRILYVSHHATCRMKGNSNEHTPRENAGAASADPSASHAY